MVAAAFFKAHKMQQSPDKASAKLPADNCDFNRNFLWGMRKSGSQLKAPHLNQNSKKKQQSAKTNQRTQSKVMWH